MFVAAHVPKQLYQLWGQVKQQPNLAVHESLQVVLPGPLHERK